VTTFVALGDSTTAGFGDPYPDGRGWRGWAALLAEGLGPAASFHNLAVSGACAADLARDQLPAALALRPDLATVLVGVNDTLRGEFDVAGIGAALDHAVGSLREGGTVVMTGCLPDPGRMFRLPDALARPLGRRVQALNALAHRVAAKYDTVHLHIPEQPGVYDPRVWSVDRLHPGERGHRLLARAYYDLLAAAGYPVGHKPAADPTSPSPSAWAQSRWMLTKGTQWFYARSTDLVPFLARMAVAEWWYRLRGTAHRLDAHVQRELAATLAHLDDSVALAPRR
jgi:lysophospholipase L1-like esterase